MNPPLPPLDQPPDSAERVTEAEWLDMRSRIIAAQTPDVRGLPVADYAAARAKLIQQAAADRHTQDMATQTARATARYTPKESTR